MSQKIHLEIIIPEELAGLRLDLALAQLLPDHTRSQIQGWLKKGEITINGKIPRARDIVTGDEQVLIAASAKFQPEYLAQDIALQIVYEDDDVLVINKPAGMVVHPGAGNAQNTLLNAILHHAPALHTLPRAGILHRLDKDTSGLLLIAKTQTALTYLSRQLKAHKIKRIYQAIVSGILISGKTIDEPIGRHPMQRTKMTVTQAGKPSVTHYRVMERYRAHTRIKLELETGRTHQIRVHMAHTRHPLLGDQTYGGRLQLPKNATPELVNALRTFKRQALHAIELQFTHPTSKELITCNAPIPNDLQELIKVLVEDNKHVRK